jgi:hypothetical protein
VRVPSEFRIIRRAAKLSTTPIPATISRLGMIRGLRSLNAADPPNSSRSATNRPAARSAATAIHETGT